jgi:hypothetical protein
MFDNWLHEMCRVRYAHYVGKFGSFIRKESQILSGYVYYELVGVLVHVAT